MDQFLDYMSRFVPDFRSRIDGASGAEVAALEQAVARPLPESYRQFLARMGRNAGGISLGFETTTDILAVTRFHTRKRRPVPPDCVAIAVRGVDFDVCLHLPPSGGERVLASDGVLVYVILAETLPKALFQYAFRNHEVRSFPHVAAWSIDNIAARAYASANGRSMRDTARELVRELGFEAEWFSDEYSLCGRKDGTSIFILQQEEQGEDVVLDMGAVVAIGAATKEDAERLGAPFQERLGLRPGVYRGIV
jgi:hypothetical protein